MNDLERLRETGAGILSSTVIESLEQVAGEQCWVLRGQRLTCHIWDSERDYWEVDLNQGEKVDLLELSKASNVIMALLEEVDRRSLSVEEARLFGIRIASWVETADGRPLVYDGRVTGRSKLFPQRTVRRLG